MRPDRGDVAARWRAYSAARVARAEAEIAVIRARETADAAEDAYDLAGRKCDAAAAAWRAAIDHQTTDPDGAVPAGNPKED